MTWARVDDGWWCHPKTVRLDLTARGLWVSVLSWSCAHRTAAVPPQLVVMLGADEATGKQIEATGLWHGPGHDCDDCQDVEDGWVIHDWSEYQERSLSEKRAEAGRKGGKKSRPPKQTPSNREADTEAGARPVPSRTQDQTPGAADAPRETDPLREAADPLTEAVADACGVDWRAGLGKAARSALKAAVADLRTMNATPEQVPRRARAYQARWPDAALTPAALAKHWPALGATNGTARTTGPPVVGSPEWDARQRENDARAAQLGTR